MLVSILYICFQYTALSYECMADGLWVDGLVRVCSLAHLTYAWNAVQYR